MLKTALSLILFTLLARELSSHIYLRGISEALLILGPTVTAVLGELFLNRNFEAIVNRHGGLSKFKGIVDRIKGNRSAILSLTGMQYGDYHGKYSSEVGSEYLEDKLTNGLTEIGTPESRKLKKTLKFNTNDIHHLSRTANDKLRQIKNQAQNDEEARAA